MEIPKFSPKALLQVNFVLGAFVALTNGSAFFITASGGRSQLGGHLGEIAAWTAAGLALLSLSLIGIRRPESSNKMLEAQVALVYGLVGALIAWGIAVASGAYRIEGAFAWSAGFLSALGVYCYVLYSNVTVIRGWGRAMRPFAVAFVVLCIVVDVAAFLAVMKA